MKKVKNFLSIIFMVLCVFFVFNNVKVSAYEKTEHIVDVVDNIEVFKEDGSSITKYDNLLIRINWSEKEKLKSGDVFYIELPEEFYSVNATFPMIINSSGTSREAGICIIENNKLKCIFNDFVNDHFNIRGSIYIERLFIGSSSTNESKVPLDFLVNNNKHFIDIIDKSDVNNVTDEGKLSKYGFFDTNKNLVWNLKIKLDSEMVENLVVEDYLGEGQILDKDSLRIFTCDWNEDGELIYESLSENLINNFKTEIGDNYFKIFIGNTDKNYFVTYNVKFQSYMDEYYNRAKITGDNILEEEVELYIESLKDFADIIGDNEKFEEIEDEISKEETNVNKEEISSEPVINNTNEDLVKTGDKLNIEYIIILAFSILNICIHGLKTVKKI